MAELDGKRLQNLDEVLQQMNKTLATMETTLKDVGVAMTTAFGSATQQMVKNVQQAFRGAQLSDMLGIDQAKLGISDLQKEIKLLEGNLKSGSLGKVSWNAKSGNWKYSAGKTKMTDEQEYAAKERLRVVQEQLNNSMMSQEELMRKIVGLASKATEEAEKESLAKQSSLKKSIQLYQQYAQEYLRLTEQMKRETSKDGTLTKRGQVLAAERSQYRQLMHEQAVEIRNARSEGVRLSQEEELKLEVAHRQKLRKIREQYDKQTDEKKGTKGAQERALQEANTRKAMKEINRLLDDRNMKEANLAKEGKTDKYYDLQKRKIEEINKKIEEQKRLLGSYGISGERALRQLGGGEKQSDNLKRLIEEGRELEKEKKRLAKVQQEDAAWQEKQRANQAAMFVANGKAIEQQRQLADQIDRLTRKREGLVKSQSGSSTTYDSRNYPLVIQIEKKIEELRALQAQIERQFQGSMKAGESAFASTKAERDNAEARKKIAQEEINASKQKAQKAKEAAAIQKKADAESMVNQRRQIQIKSQLAAIDKNRITITKQSSDKEKALAAQQQADYKSLQSELSKLIARQKELNTISQGSGRRAKDRLSTYTISESEKAMRRYADAVRNAQREQKKLGDETNKILPTIQRLASAFGIAFSVRGLAQFGKKLIETRGEFEMQFVAMKQIIGDVDAATKIWNQTMRQALQSPFKAMQLVTYTKQLAAYRIETEKLFDTTKRLADISAGLGVDMGRLILAYGQVKSANFLRASEVRQFTEAGVNIVGNLAKYFTELEGRAVGTAEVMERITKRMVLFSDVEAIFKRMTDEGGEFYNMQEVQADTVKGQIQKLHDAYDQMLNTIGQANQGTIRNFVDTLNSLVRNWQNVAFVLKANINWITIFGASLYALSNKYMKGATTQTLWFGKALLGNDKVLLKNVADVRIFGKVLGDFTLKQRVAIVATRTFQSALSAVGNVMKTLWPLLVFEGITLLIERLTRASRELKRFREELQEVASTNVGQMGEEINGYDTLIKKLKQTTDGTMARKEVLDEISRRYGKYIDFIITEKTTVEELAGAYDKVVSSIRNYTAEKIREEQQQKLEKGLYDEYQDLINNLEGASIQFEGGWLNLSKSQAKNIAKLVEKSLKETGEVDLQSILEKYLGLDFDDASYERINYYVEGIVNSYVKAYKGLKGELQEIRDDVEGQTPVFASEAEYEQYKKNVEEANQKISEQNKKHEEQIDLVKQKTEEQWKIDDEIAKLRLKNEEEILRIRKEYGLISEGQYNDELARLHGRLDTYETDYNKRLAKAMSESYGETWQTSNKEARDMYNYVVSTEQALAQGTTQRNKQLKESYKGFKDSLEQYNAQFEAAEKSGASKEALDKIQADIDLAKLMMAAIELAANLRGIDLSEKKKNTRTTHENASKLISLIKEMRSEYDKLSKSAYGYAKSEEKVRNSFKQSYEDILKETGVAANFDFTTNQGEIEALKKVRDYIKGNAKYAKDAWKDVQKTIDQLTAETEIEISVRIREDFGKQMEEMFNDYELTLELQKLNIPTDAAKDLFPDFTEKTLGDLQKRLREFYEERQKKDENGNVLFSEEDLKEYRKWADKIDAEILKERKEKAKEYSKYLEKEYSERAKLEMQHAKDVAFVTANVADDKRRNTIIANINKKYQDDLNELRWKSFKESSFYVDMMDDIASLPAEYTKIMLDKINEILEHPEKLSPRALKEAVNARQKVIEAQIATKPLSVMTNAGREIREARKLLKQDEEITVKWWESTRRALDEQIKAEANSIAEDEKKIDSLKQLQGELSGYEQLVEDLKNATSKVDNEGINKLLGIEGDEDITKLDENAIKNRIKSLNDLMDSEKQLYDPSEKTDEQNARAVEIEQIEKMVAALNDELNARKALASYVLPARVIKALANGETSASVGSQIAGIEASKEGKQKRLTTWKEYRKQFKNFSEAFADFNKNLNEVLGKVRDMGNAWYDMFDALGGETNVLTDGWKEFGNTITDVFTKTLTLLPQMVVAFQAAGTSINASLGVIGLIAEAVQLVFVAIGAFAKLHDARYGREIEIQQKKIDDLQRAYERLEKSIEETWDTASYIRTYNKETQNLYEQIEALNNQIAAEEAKKNADKDKIQGYEDSIQEALDKLEELKQAQIEVFGGIGDDGYRDAAQGFVDAWKSAFLETGDGLQGLQDHFDEFLNDWFVKQATMRYASAALEPVFKMIDDAVDPYGAGGANVVMQELEAIKEWVRVNFPQISDTLEEISRPFIGEGEGSLSGLAAGIQGMTEEQATSLEAYWNSVRGYTDSIDMNVARIVDMMVANYGGGRSVESNPMLQQLNLIAANTAATHTILQSVTKSGHTMGGSGIKVFVD